MLTRLFSVFTKKAVAVPLPLLRFRNTLSGEPEAFEPLSRRAVKMYNCGPTVYDRATIGNLRAYIFADTIARTLRYWGYGLKQVINITDVGHLVSDADEGEDKMEKSARLSGRSAQDIAREYTKDFFDDLDALGINRAAIEFPRATEYIAEQIILVRTLEEKGYTYRGKKGVYYDTSRFPAYGKLGGISLSGMREGARVEKDPDKRNPHDFFLWKFADKGVKREQEWDSPWGVGFPGWHIECTAMIFKLLGKQIDIHTGGVDHIPVHHNNEIAQAEGATGKRYVKYWMHSEFITVEGKKISKSLGNTVYLYNVTDRGFSPLSLRYWFLTAHYRTPVNFTWEAVAGANAALARLRRFFLEELPRESRGWVPDPAFMRDVLAAMADDLDTPRAVARVWELVKDESVSPAAKRASLLEVDRLLGFGLGAVASRATAVSKLGVATRAASALPDDIQELADRRAVAREAKDFGRADELRAKIEAAGYDVVDTPDGSKIAKKIDTIV